MFSEIRTSTSTGSTADSITSSSGYTYAGEATLTYTVNAPPTESGSGSGSSWSDTDSHRNAQSDYTSGYWIGDSTGNSWVDTENHVAESWNGGSNMDQSWSQTYGDGSAPLVTSSSDPFGSGTQTTNGSLTSGGTGSATQTTTFPESIQPVAYYFGRGGPGSTNSPTGEVGPSAPSVYGGGQQQSSGGGLDANGNPIQLVSSSTSTGIGAAAGAATKPTAPATGPTQAPSGPRARSAPEQFVRGAVGADSDDSKGNPTMPGQGGGLARDAGLEAAAGKTVAGAAGMAGVGAAIGGAVTVLKGGGDALAAVGGLITDARWRNEFLALEAQGKQPFDDPFFKLVDKMRTNGSKPKDLNAAEWKLWQEHTK